MNDERLTNYDRYVLAKRNSFASFDVSEKHNGSDIGFASKKANSGSNSDEYEEYLINELRRTKPSDRPIMRKEEYYSSRSDGAAVKTDSSFAEVSDKRKAPRLKKSGKILLIVYVIFMVALASILIVSNTTSDAVFGESASAIAKAADSSSSDAGQIRAMSIDEEDGEETGWFDRLCDSLNK